MSNIINKSLYDLITAEMDKAIDEHIRKMIVKDTPLTKALTEDEDEKV
jgi:hypothetical protein